MKHILLILTMMLASVGVAFAAAPSAGKAMEESIADKVHEAEEETHEEKLDLKETIFEHLGDGYGWEVPFNHHKRIPLPVIVWGKDGLHVFSSARGTD